MSTAKSSAVRLAPESELSAAAVPQGANGNATPRISPNFVGPVDTNAWWTSLVWQRHAGANFGENMHPHPFSLHAQADGMRVGRQTDATVTDVAYYYAAVPYRMPLTLSAALKSAPCPPMAVRTHPGLMIVDAMPLALRP